MMMRRWMPLILIFLMVLLVMGCSGYARLRLQSGPNETMTLEKLKENWQSYNVLMQAWNRMFHQQLSLTGRTMIGRSSARDGGR